MRKSLVLFCACFAALAISRFAAAQVLIAGLFQTGNDGYAMWTSSDWERGRESFTAKWAEYEKSGLRMVDFETYVDEGVRYYTGIFRSGDDGHAAWITSNWSDGKESFTAKWAEFESSGLRMTDFETWVDGDFRMYAGIYREGSGGHAAWITSNWSDGKESFTAKWTEFENSGLRMTDFETWVDGRVRMYAGLFREGKDGHAAWITSNWSDGPESFTAKWTEWQDAGLRMIDLETWMEGGERVWCGIFREGKWGYAAWVGVDWENFTARWNEWSRNGLRLFDIEIYESDCETRCLNQVVMPGNACATTPPGNCLYNYFIPGGATHCEGDPDACTIASINAGVLYRQPIDIFAGNQRYARLSALDIPDQIFSLPFSKFEGAMWHNGWLYSPGSWHHAIDWSKDGGGTFRVRAMAPGRIIWIGWEIWSGNTVIMSHDIGNDQDRYRTIYMHLRNGADNDCTQSWNMTEPWLATWDDLSTHNNYVNYLNSTGCKQNPAQRNLDSSRWGANADTINAGLMGQQIDAGTVLGWAGAAGPGGCGCSTGGLGPNTHLHVFFAHRDPIDNQWYFFDPYGIYATPDCYPPGQTDFLGACARYPNAWRGGHPQYPEDLPPLPRRMFRRGDANGDGDYDITDAISSLSCLFLGTNCGECRIAADTDRSGDVDITDPILTLSCLFLGLDCRGLNQSACEPLPAAGDSLGCIRPHRCP